MLKRKDPTEKPSSNSSGPATTDNAGTTNASSNKKSKTPIGSSGHVAIFPPLKAATGPVCQQAGHYGVTITNNQNLYQLQVFQGTSVEPLWEQYLGYSATGLATSPIIVGVSLEDGSVHSFYTSKGTRAVPPLVPPSPIAKIHAAGSMVYYLLINSVLFFRSAK